MKLIFIILSVLIHPGAALGEVMRASGVKAQ